MSTEDVMPTLLGLCDLAPQPTVEGLDYSRYMRGADTNPNAADNAALIECVAPFAEWNRAMGAREWRGVRTIRYTYVRDINGPWLLYDNLDDPYQQKNLIGLPEAAELQQAMEALLEKKLKQAHDEFKPADYYLEKWGYKDRVDGRGALPTKP
jgi:arylsulfatase A-like enzyme